LVKLNKIYTRTGDDGTTGLVGGGRISKADPLMAAIGDVDEANSAIGVALVSIDDESTVVPLRRVQNELFDLGADLATPLDMDGGLRSRTNCSTSAPISRRRSTWTAGCA